MSERTEQLRAELAGLGVRAAGLIGLLPERDQIFARALFEQLDELLSGIIYELELLSKTAVPFHAHLSEGKPHG